MLFFAIANNTNSANPSFQRIITDKIQSACPGLKKSRDLSLSANNIYIDFRIFRFIFEKVSRNESVIALSVEDSGRNTWVLMYQKSFALGQGEKRDLEILKRVVEELILDNEIKNRAEEYTRLYDELLNYDRIDGLKNKVEELHTYVHGGGYLGGLDACDLCDPRKLAPR